MKTIRNPILTRKIMPVIGMTLILLFALVARPLEAHTEGKMQLSAAEAGPFKLTVWTSPDPAEAGDVHVAVAVVAAEDASPVLDATVMINLIPAAGGDPLVAQASTEDSENKFLYEAIFDVSEPGEYQVNLQVTNTDGEAGAVSFGLEVVGNSGFSPLYLIPLVLLIAAIILVIVALRRPSPEKVA
jgi:hypothetical protein